MNNSHDTLYLPPDPPDFEMGLSPNLSDYIPTLGNDDSTDDPYDFPYGASDFGGNFMYTHDFKKKKKKLKKRLKRETQARVQAERDCAEMKHALTCCQQKVTSLSQALENERHAREQVENDNRNRQALLTLKVAMERGKLGEAVEDLAYGGIDALLSRGSWMFEGGNLDRTCPHRRPYPHGYQLAPEKFRLLDEGDDKQVEEVEGSDRN